MTVNLGKVYGEIDGKIWYDYGNYSNTYGNDHILMSAFIFISGIISNAHGYM